MQIRKIIRQKIFLAFLPMVVAIFSFAGCGGRKSFSVNVSNEKKQCNEILQYLSEDDAEGLKNMFCETALSVDDIDEQIQAALDFFDGKVVSHNSILFPGGKTIKDGKIVEQSSSPSIENILTDSDRKYKIKFYSWLIHEDKPKRVGISKLLIVNTDTEEECIVGDFYVVNPERR